MDEGGRQTGKFLGAQGRQAKVRQIAILAQPAMPASCAKMLDSLGIPDDARSFAALGEGGRIKPGTTLPAPVGVFPRYVEPSAS